MSAIAAVVCFAIAEVFHVAGFAKDHFDTWTFVIAGLFCLGLRACRP